MLSQNSVNNRAYFDNLTSSSKTTKQLQTINCQPSTYYQRVYNFLSNQGRMVDALAQRADEGRGSLR